MNRTIDNTTIWKIACKEILRHINGVIIYYLREYGILSRSYYDGGSVAKAKAAKVSIIKLTHNI